MGRLTSRPDPSTTYCGYDRCQGLRKIVKVKTFARFPTVRRIPTLGRPSSASLDDVSSRLWEETGGTYVERHVELDCGHTKGLIGI